MLTSKEFPDVWKHAQMKPSPKASMSTQFKDCGPVSASSHLVKVAEDVIINKLRIKLSKIVCTSQFAYQLKIGIVDALI